MASIVKQAARSLLRSPAFSLTAVASVGIGVGLAVSLFAIAQAALFPPVPYPDMDRLVEIWPTARPGSDQPVDYLTPERMMEWAGSDMRFLERISGRGMAGPLILRLEEGAERVQSEPIVGDWFGTLGVSAARGRTLAPTDLVAGAEPAVVVSDALWRNRLSTDPSFPGGTISLTGITFTVVGIMPSSCDPEEKVWVSAETLPRRPAAYGGVARLRGGATVADATQEVARLAAAQVAVDSARYGGFGATVRPFATFGRSTTSGLWLLVGVVGAVLLVGLNNLTHLFLVRAQRRSADLAVRASLGASIRQIGVGLITEAFLVAVAGGALGLFLAIWGKDLVGVLLPAATSSVEPVVGLWALVLAITLTMLVAAVVGLEPLRRLAGLDLRTLLQGGASGATAPRGERHTRNVMVATQVAVSVVLVTTAVLLNVAWQRYRALDVGYDADRVVRARPDWEMRGTDAAGQWSLARRVADRVAQRQEVEGVAVWRAVIESYPPRPEFDAVPDGPPRSFDAMDQLHSYYEVEPGTLKALGIPLIRGRMITEEDGPGSPPLALVTRGGAEVWWPGEDPLGHQVKIGQEGTWMTVVGVVEDLQSLGVLGRVTTRRERTLPLLFTPSRQALEVPVGWITMADCYGCDGVVIGVRASTATSDAARALREEISDADSDLPLLELRTFLDSQLSGYYRQTILLPGRLATAGVVVALLLAFVGAVGLVTEGVARRTREIGVRVALGASSRQVLATIAREGILTTASGLVVGLVLVVGLHRTLSGTLFSYYALRLGADTLQPSLLAGVAGGVMMVTLAVTLASAQRALSVDPVEALRSE